MIHNVQWYCNRDDFKKKMKLEGEVHVQFLAQGEYNINYKAVGLKDGKPFPFVFRVNTASQLQLENQIAYEFDALKELEVSGVTPSPLYLDDTRAILPHGVLCMSYLEGRPLDYTVDLERAAKLFAMVHSMDVAPFEGKLIEERGLCRARVEEGKRLFEDFRGHLDNLVTSDASGHMMEVRKLLDRLVCYCEAHCDEDDAFFSADPWIVVNNTEVNSHNFIIGEDNQYIIDWEKPVLSDPVQDITQFLAPTTTLWRTEYRLSDADLDQFYEAYGRFSSNMNHTHADLRSRVERYKPYLHLRALAWCAHAWVGYQGEREIRNEQTWDRICKYLTPTFMNELMHDYL